MARGNQDLLVKKNSKLESFLKRTISDEQYERIRAYESCIIVSEKDNKAFKFVILGDDCLYLTENPPKSIQEAVQLKDVISVELVKDYPAFLSGTERENTQHLAITYLASENKRRSFRRSKKSQRSGSLTELSLDRSNLSTPVSCSSSLDGSEDNGYVTNSTLSSQRPNSRGSVVSNRESRNGISKKKKKQGNPNDSWEYDSILQSLKEEIEEQADDIEIERLSAIPTSHKLLQNGDRDSVCASQASFRQLPPTPKKGAFVTVKPSSDVDNDQEEENTGCCFIKLWKKFGKNKIKPGNPPNTKVLTSKETPKSETVENRKPPDISVEILPPARSSSPIPSLQILQPHSRRSSDISHSSRLNTPVDRDRHRSGSGLASSSDLSGSITGLHLLSADGLAPDRRTAVLHIYLLNLTSPTLMLVRSAWSNYLIRATLQIDTPDNIKQKSTAIRAAQNIREKTDLLFNQLKRELLNPKNNIDDNYRLLNELKIATEKNFILKKLFWKNSDLFLFLVRNLQKYLPKSAVNLSSIDGRRQRVDEFEIVILMAEILSGMFRESEIIPDRIVTLKAERGKIVLDMLMTLTCLPEVPDKSSKQSKIKPNDEEFVNLLDEYTQVSVSAVFELFLMARQASWGYTEDNFFNISWMVRILEDFRTTEKFVERVIHQVLDAIGPSQYDALSPEESISLYQHFTVLLTFLEYSPRVTAFIYNKYREEFKYYIRPQSVAKKLPSNFPITQMTLSVADSVITKVRNAATPSVKSHRI